MPVFLILNWFVRLLVIAVPVAVFGVWGLVGVLAVTSLVAVLNSYRSLHGVPADLRKLSQECRGDPRLSQVVAWISARAQRPVPDSGVVDVLDGDKFQAEAYGRPAPGHVFATGALLDRLADDELAAVTAHELAHVWYPMKGRIVLLTAWGLLVGSLIEVGYAVALFGPHFRSAAFPYSPWLLLALLLGGRFLSVLVPAAISRRAEAQADEWACRLGCDGLCLATALWEIESQEVQGAVLAHRGPVAGQLLQRLRRMQQILGTRSGRGSWTAQRRRAALIGLCRCDLLAEGLLSRLLDGHPSNVWRTRQLLSRAGRPAPSTDRPA